MWLVANAKTHVTYVEHTAYTQLGQIYGRNLRHDRCGKGARQNLANAAGN